MNENKPKTPTAAPEVTEFHPEAPVSWNVKYWSPDGYDCQLTLRTGATEGDMLAVLTLAKKALAGMKATGCSPVVQITRGGAAAAGGNGGQAAKPEHGPEWCPIHEVDMTKHKKDGQVWYSHKTPEGEWCRGKKNGKED